MAKIANPVRFSDHFGIDSALLANAGVLNPTLNADTGLFIDPLLISDSAHPEISEGARATYEAHFTTVIKLLRASKSPGDVAWRSALKHLSFPEIKWTCLGYGAQSVSGSGSGADMTDSVIQTAKEIVELGVEDPDLFVAMALFEEGFGPDRISDMTTNVILGDLLRFNARVLDGLPVPREAMTLRLRNGKSYEAALPVNPYVRGGADPVILVPADILRDLPIAKDWSDVADAASKNEELRGRVNEQIARLWTARTLKDKDEIRRWALSGKDAFETLLEMIHGARPAAYDMAADPLGELVWRRLAATLAEHEPFRLKAPPQLDLPGVVSVVEQIIEQFRFLIEDRRFSEELYHDGRPRPEKAAQRLFFAVAHAYCKANNLDLTPEADTGNGPVDFKVSAGFTGRILVEIKLSTNGKLVKGYSRQLETYKTAEETLQGYYVVLDVGQMGEKAKTLIGTKNAAAARGEATSPILFIDASRRPSASKL
jgi:hypothetical protein